MAQISGQSGKSAGANPTGSSPWLENYPAPNPLEPSGGFGLRPRKDMLRPKPA